MLEILGVAGWCILLFFSFNVWSTDDYMQVLQFLAQTSSDCTTLCTFPALTVSGGQGGKKGPLEPAGHVDCRLSSLVVAWEVLIDRREGATKEKQNLMRKRKTCLLIARIDIFRFYPGDDRKFLSKKILKQAPAWWVCVCVFRYSE